MRRTLHQCETELTDIRHTDIQRGDGIGFESFDEYGGEHGKPFVSIRRGYPVYIAALPHAGKSEFLFEILINLSKFHGWKHAIYSGEEGSAAEVYVQIIEKCVGKAYRTKTNKGVLSSFAMSELELATAKHWVGEHFFVLDDTTDYTPKQFCAEVMQWEKELNFKFDSMSFDPFNDFVKDLKPYGSRIELWLEDELKFWRRECKTKNRAGFLVNHIASIPTEMDKESKRRYTPMPEPTEWAMGQNWYRRGFLMMTLWRPPFGLSNPEASGEPYKNNELIVAVHKAKPKGVACLGKKSIYWDWKRKRYYEIVDGKMFYAGEATSHLKALEQYRLDEKADLYGYASGRNLEPDTNENPPF